MNLADLLGYLFVVALLAVFTRTVWKMRPRAPYLWTAVGVVAIELLVRAVSPFLFPRDPWLGLAHMQNPVAETEADLLWPNRILMFLLTALALWLLFRPIRRGVLVGMGAALTVAGGWPNLLEPLMRGYTTDWIALGPVVLNLADLCLVAGLPVLLLGVVLHEIREARRPPPVPEGSVVVTGANRGIGWQTALCLAERGARVFLVCRDEAKGLRARDEIRRATGNERTELIVADLARFESVRALAEEIRRRAPDLSVLIHNAGIVDDERTETPDGHERTFVVNHLAPFLLTTLLRDLLVANAPSRILTVSSEAHRRSRLDLEDLDLQEGYHPLRAYGRSKLANILFTLELARRLEGTGVVAHCLHPGVVRTGLMDDFFESSTVLQLLKPLFRPFSIDPEKGARTSVFLAADPQALRSTGDYWIRCRRRTPSEPAQDAGTARELWRRSEEMTGVRFE